MTKSAVARSLKNVYCGQLNRTGRLTHKSVLVGSRKCFLLFLFRENDTNTFGIWYFLHNLESRISPKKTARKLKETNEFNSSRGILLVSFLTCVLGFKCL